MSGARRHGVALRVHYLAAFASFGAYLPYFPRWLEARGVRGAAMSAACSLLPAMGVVAPPVFGLVGDALELRGALLAVACAGAGLPFLVVGAVELGHGRLGVPALFALVAAFALFRAPMTMLADVVATDRARDHGDAYGRMRLFGSLGFLASAIVVGRAVDVTSGAALPLVLGGTSIAAFAAALALPMRASLVDDAARVAAPGPLAPALRTLFVDRRFVVFLVVTFLAQVAHASYDLCATLHIRDLGADGALTGIYWATGVVAEVLLMWFAEPLFARATPRALLAVGVAGAAPAMAPPLSRLESLSAVIALQPMHALSFALVWLSSLAIIKDECAPRVSSTAQGAFTAALALRLRRRHVRLGPALRVARRPPHVPSRLPPSRPSPPSSPWQRSAAIPLGPRAEARCAR